MTNLKPAILSPLPGIKILIVGRQWDQKTSDERFELSQINFHVCFSARRLDSKVTDVIRREKTATAMIPWQNIEMATSADRRVGFGNPRCRLNLMKDAHTITSPSQPLERGGKKELHSELRGGGKHGYWLLFTGISPGTARLQSSILKEVCENISRHVTKDIFQTPTTRLHFQRGPDGQPSTKRACNLSLANNYSLTVYRYTISDLLRIKFLKINSQKELMFDFLAVQSWNISDVPQRMSRDQEALMPFFA